MAANSSYSRNLPKSGQYICMHSSTVIRNGLGIYDSATLWMRTTTSETNMRD